MHPGVMAGHRVDIDLDRLGAKLNAVKENVGMTSLRANQLKQRQQDYTAKTQSPK